MATTSIRPDLFEPIQPAPPSSPVRTPRLEQICPPAPKRRKVAQLTFKSGDMKRFYLNLVELEKSPLQGERELDNMYYICEFTLANEDNDGADCRDVIKLQHEVIQMQNLLEDILECNECDKIDMMEMELRDHLLPNVRRLIEKIEANANIVPSS